MNDAFDDMEEFTEKPIITDEKLKNIAIIGEKMVKLELVVANIQAMLSAKTKELEDIREQELPDAMSEVGLASFRLESGQEIKIVPVFRVTYKKETINEFEKWLRENGHAGLVKRQLKVMIAREEDPVKAEPIIKAIKKAGYDLEDEKTIHWKTLTKWGKELEEEGELVLVPEEFINIYNVRVAKVTS